MLALMSKPESRVVKTSVTFLVRSNDTSKKVNSLVERAAEQLSTRVPICTSKAFESKPPIERFNFYAKNIQAKYYVDSIYVWTNIISSSLDIAIQYKFLFDCGLNEAVSVFLKDQQDYFRRKMIHYNLIKYDCAPTLDIIKKTGPVVKKKASIMDDIPFIVDRGQTVLKIFLAKFNCGSICDIACTVMIQAVKTITNFMTIGSKIDNVLIDNSSDNFEITMPDFNIDSNLITVSDSLCKANSSLKVKVQRINSLIAPLNEEEKALLKKNIPDKERLQEISIAKKKIEADENISLIKIFTDILPSIAVAAITSFIQPQKPQPVQPVFPLHPVHPVEPEVEKHSVKSNRFK